MPEACASGRLASRPIKQRAEHGGDGGCDVYGVIISLSPSAENMPALTMSMYAIAMNVVMPAISSVRTVVLCCFRLNIIPPA